MIFSKDIYYCIKGLSFLARSGSPSSTREISQKEGIPLHFLEKIFKTLKKSGILNSRKGVNGGYFLSMPPKRINLKLIFKALCKREFSAINCLPPREGYCVNKRNCELREGFNLVYRKFDKFFQRVTIEDFIKNASN